MLTFLKVAIPSLIRPPHWRMVKEDALAEKGDSQVATRVRGI
jgi:hypothetical protein